jgi:hypothetical protein
MEEIASPLARNDKGSLPSSPTSVSLENGSFEFLK